MRRYDLAYPLVRLAVEYDGRQHVEVVENWEADIERKDDIDDAEWRLVVVVTAGIFKDPLRTLNRVHRALLARRAPGVPLRLLDDWRPHFPGHSEAA